MFEELVKAFVFVLEAYVAAGFVFAAIFVSLGVQRLDSEARGSGVAFRSLAIPQAAARLRSVSAVWGQNTLTTEFYSDTAHQVRVRLLPNPVRELHDPDLLLYWATNAGAVPDDLSNAVLLGPFLAGKEYSIPPKQVAGYLILYSLAHRTIVDRAKVEVRP